MRYYTDLLTPLFEISGKRGATIFRKGIVNRREDIVAYWHPLRRIIVAGPASNYSERAIIDSVNN